MSDAQDAARYRFIRDHMAWKTIHHVVGETDCSTWNLDTFRHPLNGATADEAVDKAMADYAETTRKSDLTPRRPND